MTTNVTSQSEYPIEWIRDKFRPLGKWGKRDGWELNWAFLPSIREASKATLARVRAHDAVWAEVFARHLANLAHKYLTSGRTWRTPVNGATRQSTTPGTGMSAPRAVLLLMGHGWTPMQPNETLQRSPMTEERQCGGCLEWVKDLLLVRFSKVQRAVLCPKCRK